MRMFDYPISQKLGSRMGGLENVLAIDRAPGARSKSDEFFILFIRMVEQLLILRLKPPKRCCTFWDPESLARFHTKLQENLQRYYGLMLCDNINARLSSRQLSTSRHVSHTQHDHTRDTRTQYKSIHQHTKPRDQRPERDSSPLRIVASSTRR